MNDEIITHLLMCLQNMIDNGQHKLFYNDLMHNEKVIDIINARTNLQEENEDYKSRCEKAVDEIQQLIDDINNKTIIGLNNFLPKLKEIQDELADGVAEMSV